jgi:rare lipoprotein A
LTGRHSAQRTSARPGPLRSNVLRSRLLGPFATVAVMAGVLASGAYGVATIGESNLAGDATATAAPSATAPAGTSTSTGGPASASPSGSPSGATRDPNEVSRGNPRSASPSTTKKVTVLSTGTCGASFYDEPQGTANGERFNPESLTAAHKTLKFNTRVRVTNLRNGKSVIVRINDRGPYIDGRCLDLSRAAFRVIESTSAGHAQVRYEVLAA